MELTIYSSYFSFPFSLMISLLFSFFNLKNNPAISCGLQFINNFSKSNFNSFLFLLNLIIKLIYSLILEIIFKSS